MSGVKIVFFGSLYMLCAIGIMFANKLVLTIYKFPSFIFLAFLQNVFTFGIISVFFSSWISSEPAFATLKKIFPLAVCYVGDIVMGIAGTGALSLPVFTALRHFANFMILFGERIFLGVKHTYPSYFAVSAMVCGAVITSLGDLSFNTLGYLYVGVNNISTTTKSLLIKYHMRDLGTTSIELLFYCSGFLMPILALLIYLLTDMEKIFTFPDWSTPLFLFCLLISCVSAVMLNYSALQCTHYTSALTTSVLGVVKNMVVTYAGMFVGGDYVYSTVNFIGITISSASAVFYLFAKIHEPKVQTAVGTESVQQKVPQTG